MAYANLAQSYILRDRLPEAEATLQRAAERKLEIPDFLAYRYQIAFFKRDIREMEQLASLGEDNPELEGWMRDKEAAVLAASGHLQRARIMSQHAIQLSRQNGRDEAAAQQQAAAAVREVLFGNTLEARRLALLARRFAKGREAVYGSALALALAGDSPQSQKLADDLGKRFPKDTVVNFNYLPAVRAVLALNHGRPSKAVELLQAASAYEVGFLGASSRWVRRVAVPDLRPWRGLSQGKTGCGGRCRIPEDSESSRNRFRRPDRSTGAPATRPSLSVGW